MKTDYTHISIVLDRSGSMSSIKTAAEGGLNEFLKTHREAKGNATVTVAKFDDQYELEHDMRPLADVGSVALEPRGSTALLDAVGKTLTITGERLRALPEDQRPEFVFFVIVTDGQENASKEFKRDAIKAMIETQTNAYRWHFVFLGANMDAIQDARSLGINSLNALRYAPTPMGTRNSYAAVSRATMAVRGRSANSVAFDLAARLKSNRK